MKSLLTLLATMAVSVLVNAGELIIIKGSSYGYASDRLKLLEEAKKDAFTKLPFPKANQRSKWMEVGGSCTTGAMHPKCYYTVFATFENPTESAPWYFNTTGVGRGDEVEEDDLAAALAKKHARQNARWGCNSEIIEPALNWKIWKDDVGYLYASNLIQCAE